MTSNAIAGVDGWLKEAEEVLQDQHERSLSPSSTPSWDSGQVERTIAMADFEEGLETILRALCERPGRWILIAESGPHRYWQALAYEDGAIVAEVVSNHWLVGDLRWTPQQEADLRDLGWTDPDPPDHPNWLWAESTTSPDLTGVAQLAVQTLHQVFGVQDKDNLVIKQFSSPNRGGTPATPTYVVEQVEVAPLPADAPNA